MPRSNYELLHFTKVLDTHDISSGKEQSVNFLDSRQLQLTNRWDLEVHANSSLTLGIKYKGPLNLKTIINCIL